MAKWVETRVHHFLSAPFDRGRDDSNRTFSKGIVDKVHYVPDAADLARMMQDVFDDAKQEQFELKAIMPIVSGIGEKFMQTSISPQMTWGLAYGYGVSPTSGVIAVLQRVDEVAEDVFQSRLARFNAERLAAARAEVGMAQQELAKARENAQSRRAFVESLQVREVKKALGPKTFEVGGQTYGTAEEANIFVASARQQAESAERALARWETEVRGAEARLERISALSAPAP